MKAKAVHYLLHAPYITKATFALSPLVIYVQIQRLFLSQQVYMTLITYSFVFLVMLLSVKPFGLALQMYKHIMMGQE